MATITDIHPQEEHQERLSHLLARETQIALELIIVVSIIATVVVFSTLYMFAIIPATVVLIAYGLLMLANTLEKRTRTVGSDAHGPETGPTVVNRSDESIHEDHSVEAHTPEARVQSAVQRCVTRVTIECAAGAALIAVALAFSVLDWKLVTLGIFVLFAYILLVTTPVWLAWLEDDLHDEVEHQEHVTGSR
jgi:Flp pilus assembly protein TadB